MKWIFLVHQIKTSNSRERVKIWRLTKKVGAVLYRNSVYVLPFDKERLEDFDWLCQQIKDSQGEASVFITENKNKAENAEIVNLFNSYRSSDYKELLKFILAMQKKIDSAKEKQSVNAQFLKTSQKDFIQITETHIEIKKIDFFHCLEGAKINRQIIKLKKDITMLDTLKSPSQKILSHTVKEFQNKIWATRSHIHIDRLCSAWLIKNYIDKNAKFIFLDDVSKLKMNMIPFDIFNVEFGHHNDDCTFETLLKSFGIKNKTLLQISEIVHDIDLKDQKFGRMERYGIDLIVRSISDYSKDDNETLAAGFKILDALFSYFSSSK